MKNKIMILFFFLLGNYVFANNNSFFVTFYKPYGREATYTEEILFYDDGLIKQITHYDLRNECDYYNWENIKENLKIIRQFEVNREEKNIEVKEKGSEKVVTRINNVKLNVWNVENSKPYNNSKYSVDFEDGKHIITEDSILIPTAKAYLNENKLERLISCGKGYGGKEYEKELKLEFDGKNVYRITTQHEYGEDSSTVNFISDYIPFTKEAALLNQCIKEFFVLDEVFYSVPTISKNTSLHFCLFAETQEIKQKEFHLFDFYENPFKDERAFPRWFDDYSELKAFYSDYDIEDKEILNKYTQKNDKELTVKTSGLTIVYYLRSFDGKIFRIRSDIENLDILKYSFNQEMTISDVIKTCGEDYLKSDFTNNYDLHYKLNEGGTVHFLIRKDTEKLVRVVLTAEK